MSELSNKDYEKIGRTLETVVISGGANKRRLALMNFSRGVFFGLGSALGATLVITIVLYVLSLFSEIPFIGDVFEKAQEGIEQTTDSLSE